MHVIGGGRLRSRRSLNRNRPLVIAITFVALICSTGFSLWYWHSTTVGASGTPEFFSDDDGATWFTDDGTKITPFDHNGRQAVVAKVFRCRDGTLFVGYLEKLSDDASLQTQSVQATKKPAGGVQTAGSTTRISIMLKRPHTGKWVRDDDPEALKIKNFTCPGGGKDFEPVGAD